MDDNPRIRVLKVNGLIMDVRHASLEGDDGSGGCA